MQAFGLKRYSFEYTLKESTDGLDLISIGNAFHSLGPTILRKPSPHISYGLRALSGGTGLQIAKVRDGQYSSNIDAIVDSGPYHVEL